MDEAPIGPGAGANPRKQAIPRFSRRTRDPDVLTELLRAPTGGISFYATQRGFQADIDGYLLPRLVVFDLRIHQGRLLGPGPRDFVGLTVPTSGAFEVHDGGRVQTFRARAAHFLDTATCFDARAPRGSRTLAALVDRSLFEAQLRALAGEDAVERLRLPSKLTTGTEAGASVVRYLRFVWRELQRERSLLRTPRVARAVEETLAAMLVEACRQGDAEATSAGDEPSVEALRRAEDFLSAHLDRPVALPELATATGATVRTLSRAFRKKHGMGPIGFLRRRRLEAARTDLLAADGLSTTVTDVALRYGFEHLGRFAGAYRNAFGEAPSETLRY